MSADQQQVADIPQQDAAPQVVVESPVNSKSKAQQGAEIAANAAFSANILQTKTRANISASTLQDLKLPCAAVSPSGFQTEKVRTVPANVVQGSHWCDPGRAWIPTELGCPVSADAPEFVQLLDSGLTSLSLSGTPVSMEQALVLSALLARGSRIKSLNLSKALHEEPAVAQHLLDAAIADVSAEFPEPKDEEDTEPTEKLQAAVEKAKGEFSSHEAGIEFLARKKLDRTAILIASLAQNTTVTDLTLSNNQMGAPKGEEAKANYQPLRRLGKLLDVNTTINVLDLSGNLFGPAGCGIIAKSMCKNISVHTLDLSGNDIINEAPDEDEDPEMEEEDPVFGEIGQGLEALSEVLKKNKFLRTISLANNRIKPEIEEEGEDDGLETSFGKFLEPLRKYHRLTCLDLSGNELGAAGARMVTDSLLLNQSVCVLDLSDNQLGPKGFAHVARLLNGSDYITTLHLLKNDGNGKKGKRAQREALKIMGEFSEAIAKSESLTDLDISANLFGADISEVLIDGVGRSKTLKSFNFASNALCGPHSTEYDAKALTKLVEALSAPTSTIRTLNIAGNNLLAAGCEQIAASEGSLSKLVSLDISRNEIGNIGAGAIGGNLRIAGTESTLVSLDVSFNGIDDAKQISQVLRTTGTLNVLNLAHNNLGSGDAAGLQDLLDACSGRPLVEKLDISSNKLNSEHAKQVTSFCKLATPPFNTLNIYDNPLITLDDATKIVTSVRNNQSIRSLRISSQHGDPTALVDAMQATLQDNNKVTDFDCCLPADVGDEYISAIRSKLLRNALS